MFVCKCNTKGPPCFFALTRYDVISGVVSGKRKLHVETVSTDAMLILQILQKLQRIFRNADRANIKKSWSKSFF